MKYLVHWFQILSLSFQPLLYWNRKSSQFDNLIICGIRKVSLSKIYCLSHDIVFVILIILVKVSLPLLLLTSLSSHSCSGSNYFDQCSSYFRSPEHYLYSLQLYDESSHYFSQFWNPPTHPKIYAKGFPQSYCHQFSTHFNNQIVWNN